MRWTGSLAAVSATLALCLSPVLAQQAGTLTGTVTGTNGQPKSFARVQLQGASLYAAATDVSGRFTIKNFAAGGTYKVTIRQDDYAETQTLQVNGLTLTLVVHW